MDFSNTLNTDPMFGSAVFQEVMGSSLPSSSLHSQQNIGVMDFDSYSRPTMLIGLPTEIDMGIDSPTSESYCESDDATSILGFQDSVTSPEEMEDDSKPCMQIQILDYYTDDKFNADRNLVMERWGPHDVFPADKSWTIEQKAAKLIELSPCRKYSVQDVVNIESLEKAEERVCMLIEIVAGIKVKFRWNFVRPHELFKSYTVVTNCKKEKEKKDADGNTIPKRPMNAFMIWCQKCRTLMAHICPQLHNAIISKALGAAWKLFSAEERAEYEEEKIKLMAFHQYEFPDYKYRPKKKPKKSEEKSSPHPKQKSSKKNSKAGASTSSASGTSTDIKSQAQTSNSSPPMLRGINIADEARVGLDPLLKERLQVKMQVKIDSDLKRGIGKRATAIDLADLTAFQGADFTITIPSSISTAVASSSLSNSSLSSLSVTPRVPSPDSCLYIESHSSSVFDTPENSPHEPRTPPENIYDNINNYTGSIIVTTNGSNIATSFPTTVNAATAFTFDDKMAIHLQLDNNGNSIDASNNNLLPQTSLEPQSTPIITTHIKQEPTVSALSPVGGAPTSPLIGAASSSPVNTAGSSNEHLASVVWGDIKSEPMDTYQSIWSNNNTIKLEPDATKQVRDDGMPVLSVEYVESVLTDELISNYEAPDMNDLMQFITTTDQTSQAPSHSSMLPESTQNFIIENSAMTVASV